MNKKGFTLVEVLVVVVIIGILSAVALPQYRKVMEKASFTKAEVMAKSLYDSCERMVAEWGVEEWGDINSSARKLARLDIGENSLLPNGFSISGETITGAGFIYTLRNSGACYVTITKPSGDAYAGVSVGYNGATFSCSGNATACNVYGLD